MTSRSFEGRMPALTGATGWLNSAPLTTEGLRGRPVLISFWTYTCINWLRQLPYVRAWSEKYAELTVIGVHTPEFGFEQDPENVVRAVRDLNVGYPVAVDRDYAIWRAFDNHYWPALYFVDAEGAIRHHSFGEGDYERSETVIQELLTDAGVEVGSDLVAVSAAGFEAQADWNSLGSPENYTGSGRSEYFASPGGLRSGRDASYSVPSKLSLNQWALAGEWTVGEQAARLNTPHGYLVDRFRARDLHLVMGPAARGAEIRFQVTVDDRPPGQDHGLDVDADGRGTLTEQRLHQLIRQRGPIDERTFKITFLDGGAEVFAFTFG
ncbi:redoxin domain-containing protein [Kribbella sp. CWNU-51]